MSEIIAVGKLLHILGNLKYNDVLNNIGKCECREFLNDECDNEKIHDVVENTNDDPTMSPIMFRLLKYILFQHKNYDNYGCTFNQLLEFVKTQLSKQIEETCYTNHFNDDHVQLMKSPISTKIKEYLDKNRYRDQCSNIYVDDGIGYNIIELNDNEIILEACYTYFYCNELSVKYNVLTNEFHLVSWTYGSVNGRGSNYNSSIVNVLLEGGFDEVKNMFDIVLHDGWLDKSYKTKISNYYVKNDPNYVNEPKTSIDHVTNHIIQSHWGVEENHRKSNDVKNKQYFTVCELTNSIILHLLVNRTTIYDFTLQIVPVTNNETWEEVQGRDDFIVLKNIMKNNVLFSIPDQTTNMTLNDITKLYKTVYGEEKNSMCKFPSFCDKMVNVENNIRVTFKDGKRITHYKFL